MGGTESLLLFFLRFLIMAVVVAYGASRLHIPYTIARGWELPAGAGDVGRRMEGHQVAGET